MGQCKTSVSMEVLGVWETDKKFIRHRRSFIQDVCYEI